MQIYFTGPTKNPASFFFLIQLVKDKSIMKKKNKETEKESMSLLRDLYDWLVLTQQVPCVRSEGNSHY